MAAPSWIQNDYWAPDRDQVLNDPSRWGTGPNGEVDPQTTAAQKTQQPTQSVDYSGYTPPSQGQPTNTGVMPPSQGASAPAPAPAGAYNRDAFRDAWMGSGAQTPAQLAQFVNQHQGDFGAGVKIGGSKGDMITLPDGTVIDAVRAAGLGGQGAQWMGIPSQMGYGAPGAGAAGANGASGVGAPNGGSQDPMVQELLARLTNRADQSLNINAVTDPNIRQQADPYAAQLERQRRQYLDQQAEQLGPNANLTNEARLTAEQTGQAAGQQESGLIGNEIAARRQEIQDALSQMGGMLTSEQQMALQRELGNLNAATQRFGITTQANTSANALSNDWQKALLTNDQFNSRLGLDAENDYNHWQNVFTS